MFLELFMIVSLKAWSENKFVEFYFSSKVSSMAIQIYQSEIVKMSDGKVEGGSRIPIMFRSPIDASFTLPSVSTIKTSSISIPNRRFWLHNRSYKISWCDRRLKPFKRVNKHLKWSLIWFLIVEIISRDSRIKITTRKQLIRASSCSACGEARDKRGG